jgi:hypothetical protein
MNILKRTKGQSEFVYQRTDNTMAKKKVQKEKQRSTKHSYQARVPLKIDVNAGALEGSVDPAALVTPVVLI